MSNLGGHDDGRDHIVPYQKEIEKVIANELAKLPPDPAISIDGLVAGGGLAGTYPNPTVASIDGLAAGGDLAGTYPNPTIPAIDLIGKLPVSAKTQIVDPANGNDSNDGRSFDKAKATIQAAYDSLPATGGTVICLAGTNNVDAYPSGRLLLSATKPAVITSLSGFRARFSTAAATPFDCPVITGTSPVLCLIDTGYEIGGGMVFSGLHFDMRNTSVLTGILCRDMNYLRVKDCGFEGGGQEGFAIRSQEIHSGWADSMCYRIEDNFCRMISLFRGLDDTTILGVVPNYPPGGNLNNIQITNNVVFGNAGWAIDVYNLERSVLQGNNLEGGTSGIRLAGASHKNAIFWQGGEGSPSPYLQFVALAGQAGAYGNFYQNFAADGGTAVDDQAAYSDYALGNQKMATNNSRGYAVYTDNTILPQGHYYRAVVGMNKATPLTLTLNRHQYYPIPIGADLTVVQIGAGAVTVAPEGGGTVIINGLTGAKLTTTFPGDSIQLLKRDINTWVAF